MIELYRNLSIQNAIKNQKKKGGGDSVCVVLPLFVTVQSSMINIIISPTATF
jgi:hypothetical protein